MSKTSETITENIFRENYGNNSFLEKSAIPKEYGFTSKSGTSYSGYPDFFKDTQDYAIIVEAKATNHDAAEDEVQFYMSNNSIDKDMVGIAVSGQAKRSLKVTYYCKFLGSTNVELVDSAKNTLLSFDDISKHFRLKKYGESITTESLVAVLKDLNNKFHKDGRVRDTDRSLFFSGLMIALNNNNFRSTYFNIQAPTKEDVATTKATVLEAHYLNNLIIDAISSQLESKINNLSKEFSWKDKFSFIRTVDYPLLEYKNIIKLIETKIFNPFKNDEKQDILGRAYKIFLSRAGKAENKNIILTPDHIKELMVRLANLTKDDVVLDTCTGSGGFLMESMETMIKLANGDADKIRDIKEKQLIGFEIDSVLFALACSNMFLHGDGKTNLLYRSSLLNDKKGSVVNSNDEDLLKYIRNLRPTKVVINPPYENNYSIKFTLQAIEYLEPNGKLIIIMPTPTLTQNQGGLTDELLKIANLDFVIKMPNRLFAEQKRSVNTSIFGFTKSPHDKDADVVFYNLEDDGFVSIQNKGRVDKNKSWPKRELEILDCVKNRKTIIDVATKKKIYNDGKLNCAGFQNLVNGKAGYKMVKIKELFDIAEGTLASNDSEDDGSYDFITAAEEWKKHSSYSHDTEALIYAVGAAGSLGRTHYVNGKFVASNLCLILTPKNGEYSINAKFYNHYFASIKKRIVSDLADGTSKLTISKDDLADYYIEYVPIDKQNKFQEININKLDKLKEKLKLEEFKLQNSLKKLL